MRTILLTLALLVNLPVFGQDLDGLEPSRSKPTTTMSKTIDMGAMETAAAVYQNYRDAKIPTEKVTFSELEAYPPIEGAEDFYGFGVKLSDGSTIGSALPKWELIEIARGMGLSRPEDLLGQTIALRTDVGPGLALNDLAVRFRAKAAGSHYTSPTAEAFLELVASDFARMLEPDLRSVTNLDQLRLAKEWFGTQPGTMFLGDLRPRTLGSLKNMIARKSEGRVTLEQAKMEDFKLSSNCMCGHGYFRLRNSRGTTQLVQFSSLLPVVAFDPGNTE